MRTVLCTVLVLFLIAGMVALPVSPVSVPNAEVCKTGPTSPNALSLSSIRQVESAGVANASAEGAELTYNVTVGKDSPTFHVSLEIENVDPGRYVLGFQVVRPENFKDYISNLRMRTQTENLEPTYLGDFAWEVNQGGGTLLVDYDVSKIVPFQALQSRDIGQKEANVYIDNEGGIFYGQYVFMKPSFLMAAANNVARIRVKFNLPSEWQLVTPYVEGTDGYYDVPRVTSMYLVDFVNRPTYFGKMRYYAEAQAGDCTVKFGVLAGDWLKGNDTWLWIKDQEDVNLYAHTVAVAIEKLSQMFGENPYPVFVVTNRFESKDGWYYSPLLFGEVQYWPPGRYDETIGHLFYSWMRETFNAPTGADYLICKGIGESYLANKWAYEVTGDKAYLGKIYHYYLVYKAAQNTGDASRYEIHDEYYRGCVIGLWLDSLIQGETAGKKSLETVLGYLYQEFRDTRHEISVKDLEHATDLIAGQDNSALYAKYVDGDEDIPVEGCIGQCENSFPTWLKVLESDNWLKEYHGYSIPFFVDVEMAMKSSYDLPLSILVLSHSVDFAKYVFANHDVSALTKADVETALNALTGQNCAGFFDRWKDSYGALTIDEMKDWLRSYMPYAPQELTAVSHGAAGVNLAWKAVQPRYMNDYYMITGYAVYRGTSLGTETFLADVFTTTYTDTSAVAGQAYYYYVKSIENQPFGDGRHVSSGPSAEVPVLPEDATPPLLTIVSPDNGAVVATGIVVVSGRVRDDGSGVAGLTVNGDPVSLAADGSFSTAVNLSEGLNDISILAVDEEGNRATKTLTVTCRQTEQSVAIVLRVGQPSFTVNGALSTLDSPPIIKNGRTLLPIRAVIESLGGVVAWDGTGAKTTVTLGTTTLELWIGKPQALVNHNAIAVDAGNAKVVPEIVDGRTMLPLRFVVENLGFDVQWEPATKTITITHHQ